VQAKDILKVYPPFVNFFEVSKETLHRCDKQYPRFHAFLKVRKTVMFVLYVEKSIIELLFKWIYAAV